VYCRVLGTLNARYATELVKLRALKGDAAISLSRRLTPLMWTGCACVALTSFEARLASAGASFTDRQLATLMCDGVAARLTDAGFGAALAALRTGPLELPSAQVVTLVGGGVAARLTDAGFAAALAALRTGPLELTSAQVVTLVCGGVAARLTDAGFAAALASLRTGPLELTSAQVATLVCGQVAKRMGSSTFMAAVGYLLGAGLSCAHLRKIATSKAVHLLTSSAFVEELQKACVGSRWVPAQLARAVRLGTFPRDPGGGSSGKRPRAPACGNEPRPKRQKTIGPPDELLVPQPPAPPSALQPASECMPGTR
jgi:hypothetical protein